MLQSSVIGKELSKARVKGTQPYVAINELVKKYKIRYEDVYTLAMLVWEELIPGWQKRRQD